MIAVWDLGREGGKDGMIVSDGTQCVKVRYTMRIDKGEVHAHDRPQDFSLRRIQQLTIGQRRIRMSQQRGRNRGSTHRERLR